MDVKFLLLPLLICGAAAQGDKPSIYSLHIRSDITYRFATTQVVSKLANPAQTSMEAVFSLQLPKTAFISNFSMVIDDIEYAGNVKEKEQAKRDYEKAKSKGQSAGKVSAKPRDTSKFQVSVNVEAGKKVDFKLTYQELLQRKLGLYVNTIYIDPKQPVRDFKVDFYINESRPIKNLFIAPLKKDNEIINTAEENTLATKDFYVNSTKAHISYHPSYKQQTAEDSSGLQGRLVLRYDVERDQGAGEIQVVDGFFVHFFSPKGLEKGNKNIIFILDVSGSMHGTKLLQLKDSMSTILNDLGKGDLFNIMLFESSPKLWKKNMQNVDRETKTEALDFVAKMRADGGTNINSALVDGIAFLDRMKTRLEIRDSLASIIVFLTDGDPTSGVTNKEEILINVRNKNEGRFALYSLGFGANMDFKFLQRLSAQNRGLARKIYEDSDASLQLNNFYNEISSPLLADVAFNYVGSKVYGSSLTNTRFPSLFEGSEFVVAGKVSPIGLSNGLEAAISARSAEGPVVYGKNVKLISGNSAGLPPDVRKFTERLWAYLTIRELMDKMLATTNKTVEAQIKQKALNMSLKYNFVTPLTSMVVIKPDDPTRDASRTDEGPSGSSKPSGSGNTGKASIPRRSKPSAVKSFADNDPHFMISVSGGSRPVCFDVNGQKDDIFQLLHDKEIGLAVNARIIDGGRTNKKGKPLTYFGKIAVVVDKIAIVATPHSFRVDSTSYNWKRGQELQRGAIRMIWPDKGRVVMTIKNGVEVTLARHVQKGERNDKAHYLGFYINNGQGFSKHVHGLMGQFQHRKISIMENAKNSSTAKLTFIPPNRPHRGIVEVHHGGRRNLLNKEHVQCWHVRNQGRGFLDGVVSDYKVSKMTTPKLAKKLANHLKKSTTNSAKVRISATRKKRMHVE